MATDYGAILAENQKRYGTDIGRIGPMLMAERYAERTHFIYELLQNAEDALGKRLSSRWQGPRSVNFVLGTNELRVSHWGKPFDERDVRGICGIAESTKNELTEIGRFGIGFKSVYAFTDRPEIHSGDEDFHIDSFVWPATADEVEREKEETVIVLPLRPQDGDACDEIAAGLRKLGPATLLFLHNIDEISWHVEAGPSGQYLRESKHVGDNAHEVVVLGNEEGQEEVEQTWLVFSREVMRADGRVAGQAKIAFLIADDEVGQRHIRRVEDSPLVAFFPTAIPTHLGFMVQGPYRTTPSRDNVPAGDDWNQHLVRETAALLTEALPALRDRHLLDADALRVMPLRHVKFQGRMFQPIFEAVRDSLRSRPLLPCFGGGHVAAFNAVLSRTKALRDLLTAAQLTELLGDDGDTAWLSEEITQDRMPVLRRYLTHELEVPEFTPQMLLPKLSKEFLEAQTDEWIIGLYTFLNDQSALRPRLKGIPLVRLADGSHVAAHNRAGKLQAFLPSTVKSDFPTVRPSVCSTEEARGFLASLGLREPDPVDDVIDHVLPRYQSAECIPREQSYASDIDRISAAFQTDSTKQKDRLKEALRDSLFVKAIDAGDGSKVMAKPEEVYLA
ncbi:MAG: hypothetical protein KGY78_03580, partial [Anaerolineae bacterium]|nr:hypothetical protein [Anaerolineae bacterium]